MRFAVPESLNSEIEWSAPTFTMARLARVSWNARFRFDTFGVDPPFGYAVTNVGAVTSVAVMFTTTADAPAGTGVDPPATTSDCTPWGVNVCSTVWSRLSPRRVGEIDVNVDVPAAGGEK